LSLATTGTLEAGPRNLHCTQTIPSPCIPFHLRPIHVSKVSTCICNTVKARAQLVTGLGLRSCMESHRTIALLGPLQGHHSPPQSHSYYSRLETPLPYLSSVAYSSLGTLIHGLFLPQVSYLRRRQVGVYSQRFHDLTAP
jgi:hypothetical protein